jgi:hypothetical protein
MAQSPKFPLPKSGSAHVKSAILNVISLGQYASAYTRGWAVNPVEIKLLVFHTMGTDVVSVRP